MAEITWEKDDQGQALVTLSGEMTVEHAAKLHETLLAALQGCDTVRMDLTGVEKGDLTFYQLVCSSYKYSRKHDKEFLVTSVRPAISRTARDMGFTWETTDGNFWKGEEDGQEDHDG